MMNREHPSDSMNYEPSLMQLFISMNMKFCFCQSVNMKLKLCLYNYRLHKLKGRKYIWLLHD